MKHQRKRVQSKRCVADRARPGHTYAPPHVSFSKRGDLAETTWSRHTLVEDRFCAEAPYPDGDESYVDADAEKRIGQCRGRHADSQWAA